MKKTPCHAKVPPLTLVAGEVTAKTPLPPAPSAVSVSAEPVKLGRGKYSRDRFKDRKPMKVRSVNPLVDLPGALKMNLLKWQRNSIHDDAILQMLDEAGVQGITPLQLTDFFQFESQQDIETRFTRAALEANSLIRAVEKTSPKFCPATLAALEQEIFRQISNGEAEPAAISKLGALFLKVRSHLRADEIHILRSEKLRRELQGQIDHALEKLADEVAKNPAIQGTFDVLRLELANTFVSAGEDEEADEDSE